jgi:hypothetical protein
VKTNRDVDRLHAYLIRSLQYQDNVQCACLAAYCRLGQGSR